VSTVFSRLREYPRALLFILALGLVFRTLFISLHQRPLISDEREYGQLAYNLYELGSYTYDGSPTAYRPVGYPALVSMVYFVVGHHPIAVKFLQGFLDILIALMIYHLLAGFSSVVRLLGAAFWAFYPPAILYTNYLMSESVFTLLLVSSVLLLLKSILRKPGSSFALGLLFGALVLMKPSFLLVILVLTAFLPKLQVPVRSLVFVALGALLVVSPWLIRNYRASGTVVLSSNGGINLLIGNNPNSTGAYAITFPPEAIAGARDEFEVNRRASEYAVRYIVEHPGAFLVNGVKKIAHLFESEGGLLVWSFHDSPEDRTVRYATKYASIPLLLVLLVNVPYAIFLMTGVVWLVGSVQNKLWWTFAAILGSWLLIHFVFFGGGRFHFPLMPFFVVLAAEFLPGMKHKLHQLSTGRKVLAAVAVLGLLSIWIYEAVVVINA